MSMYSDKPSEQVLAVRHAGLRQIIMTEQSLQSARRLKSAP